MRHSEFYVVVLKVEWNTVPLCSGRCFPEVVTPVMRIWYTLNFFATDAMDGDQVEKQCCINIKMAMVIVSFTSVTLL